MLLGPASARSQNCPTRPVFPAGEWPREVEQTQALRPEQVAALTRYAFTLEGEDSERKGIRSDAVVIVQHGAVIYEKYARGWEPSTRHLTWSVTKSVINALVGIAVRRGRLALDAGICRYLDLSTDEACDVQVADLLEFASGFEWKETYEDESPAVSSVIAMLYGEGHDDMPAFVAGHAQRDAPGESYAYSSGDSTLLAAVVSGALAAEGEAYPWALLFEPLGIASTTIERDRTGNFVGSSYWYATPRDMARFGMLYLDDGCWAGRRILPEGWVTYSTEVSPAFFERRPFYEPGEVLPGRHWWLNRTVEGLETPWPDVPADAFAALGHWGQSITVIPSWDLVVVRTGDDREEDVLDNNEFLKLALAVAQAP